MGKSVYIAEKPSVAKEFARVLGVNGASRDGYIESGDSIVTWCVGHLITMSYPEDYNPDLKRWQLDTIPFIPTEWKYRVIDSVKKQFDIVKAILTRPDVENIYICTDSGREGEYIYRLVDKEAGVTDKKRYRVWIDSQTEEEILKGIREAKDWSFYDNLSDSAYLRAQEDYLMGINFSRVLTLKYAYSIKNYLKQDRLVISVGRVMTCVLGMIVRREREIRDFVKMPFYRVIAKTMADGNEIDFDWKVCPTSMYFETPYLYKDNGLKDKLKAQQLIDKLKIEVNPLEAVVTEVTKKKENKKPPLLYNLAELQNACSKKLKISPDETLKIVQSLYEKKLVTYPRTDARVLSSAIAKQIKKNLDGLSSIPQYKDICNEIISTGSFKGLEKTRYVDDKQITDHYAIIPTGQGFGALKSLSNNEAVVYDMITKRLLAIFLPQAVYMRYAITAMIGNESFTTSCRVLKDSGYLKIYGIEDNSEAEEEGNENLGADVVSYLEKIKKGAKIPVDDLLTKEGETSPPKRYNSGSIILAMENAGQLIENEELRAQIKGSGIGTSATRAEILKKLVNISYISLNEKTQILTPTLLGELVYEAVNASIKQLLNPELTASWEKGLTMVADGKLGKAEYMEKLSGFVTRRTEGVKKVYVRGNMDAYFDTFAKYYKK
ncbi:MAG TPA: DNA topoisomerase III [Eubacterium sp.]|nr:DNA topoisomerase III [Eubacterium sp.]